MASTDRTHEQRARTQRIPTAQRHPEREVDVTDEAVARRAPRAGTAPAPVHVAGNGSAVAALVVGLLSATYGFFVAPALAAIVFGLVAVVLGVRGLGVANRLGGLHRGLAITGIVSGALGLLLGVAIVVGGITLFNQIEQSDLPEQIRNLTG